MNAGAIWEDKPVVIDRHFVSSRKPDDLPDFCRGILGVPHREDLKASKGARKIASTDQARCD